MRFRPMTVEDAEKMEPGCTGHTIMFVTNFNNERWHCHQRLGIRWRESDLIEYRTKEMER